MTYDFDAVETFHFAISKACASMPLNKTVSILETDHNAVKAIGEAIESMGQTKFKNLTSSSRQSMTAIALYAGDGIVTKIIPQSSLGHTKDVIYHLPAITTKEVSTEDNNFVIKTYPYVSPSNVKQPEVDELQDIVAEYGMEFNNGDALPKNVHRLPDSSSTLIGIDSDMYHYGKNGSQIDDETRGAWINHIHTLFPIYEHRQIPEQTDETNFDFISIHDPENEIHAFEEDETNNTQPDIFPEP